MMTLIVSWAALDCKNNGPSVASIYFASDSRFSWKLSKQINDYGQKVFGCTNMPEIFAFCGDVVCPKTFIEKIVIQIDSMHEGSGKNDFNKLWAYHYGEKNFNYRTSRAVYQCLYETLSTTEEWTVGRIPQIVGLYRKFNSRFYGIIHNGKRYCIGSEGIVEVNDSAVVNFLNVEWRNECFEIADPNCMKRMEGAQPQPFFQKKQLPGSPQNEMK